MHSDVTIDTQRPMSDEEARQMQRQHIVCVNGSAVFLEVLRELFEDERYNVTTTNFVPRTFDQIAVLQPDLIVVDLEVTRRAGWDLLERLAQSANTAEIPVVITSTDQRLLDTANTERLRYGGVAHLIKPLDLDALLAKVIALIGRPSA